MNNWTSPPYAYEKQTIDTHEVIVYKADNETLTTIDVTLVNGILDRSGLNLRGRKATDFASLKDDIYFHFNELGVSEKIDIRL